MEHIKYIISVILILGVFFVWIKLKQLYKKIRQQHQNCYEQYHVQKKKLSDLQKEIDHLKQQLTEANNKWVNYNAQAVLERQQTQNVIRLLEQKISQLDSVLNETQNNYHALQKELEFFTEIKSDSNKLNATSPVVQQEASNENSSKAALKLDIEQQAAFDLIINSGENVFVTGKAGTGKSYLLRLLVQNSLKKVLVMAPTGIAALNVEGATLHSTFGYDNLVMLEADQINENTIKLKGEKKKLLSEVETIIIDEISMVRSDTFTKIDKILRVLNDEKLPFGGKQLVIFGDLFQLPPVAKGKELQFLIDTYGGRYFFHSPAYKNAQFHLFELTINHRQKSDKAFFEMLNRLREGNISQSDIEMLNKRANADITSERRLTKLFPHKAIAEKVNSDELNKISAKEYVYPCEIAYAKKDLTPNLIDDKFPITAVLKLKLGALIMMVSNDAKHRWVNGTLGIVSYLDEKTIKVTIDGFEHELSPEKFKEQEAIYEDGKISYQTTFEVSQFPLILAYAMTIHKSQGMTYNKIGCDINKCFEPGQAYVALSRCTNLEGLYLLDKVDPHSLRIDKEVVDFYHRYF